MSIPPVGPPAGSPPRNAGKSRLSDDTSTDATQRRILQDQQAVEQADREAQVRLDHMKEENEAQEVAEASREESAQMAQKNRNYQAILELQRAQQAELNRIRREGDRQISEFKDYYRNTESSLVSSGDEKLRESRLQNEQQLNFEQKTSTASTEQLKRDHGLMLERLKQEEESQEGQLTSGARQHYEKLRADTQEANEKADQAFQARFQNRLDEENRTLYDLESRASHELNAVRQETSHKLDAYSSRQDDPFYKMVDLNARLKESDEAYILTATIPEHEQPNVSVSVKGNELVLSGYRRNEEKLTNEEGVAKSTSAYQSFHESFPLTFPVESRQVRKVFDGNRLTVVVPKAGMRQPYQPYRATASVERVRLERPDFPPNLPHTGQDAGTVPSESGDSNPKKRSGLLS